MSEENLLVEEGMTPERWQRVKDLFHTALAREAHHRAAFLAEACAGDLSLLAEVESLIASHEQPGTFLDARTVDLTAGQLPEIPTESVVGKSIGPYLILSPLGAGGMAQVYLAQDERLGRNVALKLLSAHFTRDRNCLRRFQQEARAASALNHPNIVTIHEIGEAEPGHYIVMEYIEGSTLRAMSARRHSIEKLARMGKQMARALSVAHAAGIIHRDIKLENIMVREDGYVKVLDFGVARLMRADDSQINNDSDSAATGKFMAATAPGIIIGTLRYMSPEQARAEQVTSATDIFSLGIVFYEMATGRHPFKADTQIATLNAIISQPAIPPSRLNLEIPTQLEALILQMLEKEPSLRPDASEVDAALADIALKQADAPPSATRAIEKRHTVGRERERADLRDAFDQVNAGRGLLLCVSGEPGIGKTTLVEDFLGELSADAQSCVMARGRCSERLAGTEAYLPFLEILESLMRGETSEMVVRMMKLMAPTWYVQVSPFADDDSSGARRMADIKTASQERLKRELSALFEEISRIRPIVLFLDDLHWADVSTVELLAYLASRFEAMRVLVVATYRSSDLLLARHPFLQVKRDLQSRGICHQIQLQFLDLRDIERYLALEFHDNCFPADFPALIHEKTEGSPLFMVDLLHYLRDRKIINQDQGCWILTWPAPVLGREQPDSTRNLALPESIRSMIHRKIDQLSEEEMRLLIAASVQGYEFDSAILAKALEMDPAEVEERLYFLDRHHAFVRLVKEREFPDRAITLRYRFIHVLYQNALYSLLMPTRRAALSGAVAQALLDHYGDHSATIASRLAFLFEGARDFKRASEFFLMAAQHAIQVFANHEAVALARRGLKALKGLPDSCDRDRQELMLQITLGLPLAATQGYGALEAEQTYSRARELCRQLDATSHLFPVLWGLFVFYYVRGELEKSLDLAEQLMRLAESERDPETLLTAHAEMGYTLCHLGRPMEALEHLEQVTAIYNLEHEYHPLIDKFNPNVYTTIAGGGMAARVLWLLGYPDRALKRSREALAIAERLGHPSGLSFALVSSSIIHLLRGEFQESERKATVAMPMAREHGVADIAEWSKVFRASAASSLNPGTEALLPLREGVNALQARGAEVLRVHCLAFLAEACARIGQLEESLNALDEADALARRTGDRYYRAELHRLRGETLLLRAAESDGAVKVAETESSLLNEAESCFNQALAEAREQGAKSWELRAAIGLSRLWKQQGKRDEAHRLLAEVYNWFTEGFDTADLKAAAALLEELS